MHHVSEPPPPAHRKWDVLRAFYQYWLSPIAVIALLVWVAWVRTFAVYPPIGAYIAILAFLGIVITIWAPEKSWNKVAWLLVFFGVLLLEINNLYHERDENQREQLLAKKQEDDRFAGILSQNQKEFGATMERMQKLTELSAENINEVTGGGKFSVCNDNDGKQ